jgi:hypothetical protein
MFIGQVRSYLSQDLAILLYILLVYKYLLSLELAYYVRPNPVD